MRNLLSLAIFAKPCVYSNQVIIIFESLHPLTKVFICMPIWIWHYYHTPLTLGNKLVVQLLVGIILIRMDLGGLAIASGAFLLVTIHHSLTANGVEQTVESSVDGNEISVKDPLFSQLVSIGKENGIEIKKGDDSIVCSLVCYLPLSEADDVKDPGIYADQLFQQLSEADITFLKKSCNLAPGEFILDVDSKQDPPSDWHELLESLKKRLVAVKFSKVRVNCPATEIVIENLPIESISEVVPSKVDSRRKSVRRDARLDLPIQEHPDDDMVSVSSFGNASSASAALRSPRARKSVGSRNVNGGEASTKKRLPRRTSSIDEESVEMSASTHDDTTAISPRTSSKRAKIDQ